MDRRQFLKLSSLLAIATGCSALGLRGYLSKAIKDASKKEEFQRTKNIVDTSPYYLPIVITSGGTTEDTLFVFPITFKHKDSL